MGPNRIFLGLGSNVGDRLEFLRRAIQELEGRGVHVKSASSVYETEPLLVLDQPDFLNQVCEAESQLSPRKLLLACQQVEQTLGRQRRIPKGPREIDIDILFYGQQLVEEPRLSIPHPGLHARRFVLVPLAEIAPDLLDPRTGTSVRQLLDDCDDTSEVRVYEGSSSP